MKKIIAIESFNFFVIANLIINMYLKNESEKFESIGISCAGKALDRILEIFAYLKKIFLFEF